MWYLYSAGDNSLCIGFDHNVAVDKDGADDGEGEEGVGENMDSNPKNEF